MVRMNPKSPKGKLPNLNVESLQGESETHAATFRLNWFGDYLECAKYVKDLYNENKCLLLITQSCLYTQ